MKTLDDILLEDTRKQFEAQLSECLNTDTWTASNRDEKLKGALDVADNIATSTINFVKNLLERQSDGKSIIQLSVERELILGIVEFLRQLRDNLDEMDEESNKLESYSYPWLDAQIKDLIQKAVVKTRQIEAFTNSSPVEEL